jgi:hypothetical protein
MALHLRLVVFVASDRFVGKLLGQSKVFDEIGASHQQLAEARIRMEIKVPKSLNHQLHVLEFKPWFSARERGLNVAKGCPACGSGAKAVCEQRMLEGDGQ